VDILVNNAGVSSPKTIADMEMAEWNKIMDINLNGCIIGMKYVIPQMQKAGGGSIINISSIGGIVGMAGTSPYTAAKGALRVLSKSAAIEYGKDKIRVNSVHPGIIVTPMTAPTMEEGGALPYYEGLLINRGYLPLYRVFFPSIRGYSFLYRVYLHSIRGYSPSSA